MGENEENSLLQTKISTKENSLISQDGTRIGYRVMGKGPALIIVHGTGRISKNYQRLAEALSLNYTVYLYDRRGRGLSGRVSADHGIHKEVEDLVALAENTGSRYIFGHSFGGVVALRASSYLTTLKIAVYEPPISIENSIPADWIEAFEIALKKGRKAKAMAIFLKALPPPDLADLPPWAFSAVSHLVMFGERKKSSDTRMHNLLHTIPQDMRIVHNLEADLEFYHSIRNEVLLMRGTNSQSFFLNSVTALSSTLTKSRVEVFPGFDHYSPEEKVHEISAKLSDFFS